MQLYTCQILKPTKIKNGGWVRVMWCKASAWTYERDPWREHGRDRIELRVWRFSFEYMRHPEDE